LNNFGVRQQKISPVQYRDFFSRFFLSLFFVFSCSSILLHFLLYVFIFSLHLDLKMKVLMF